MRRSYNEVLKRIRINETDGRRGIMMAVETSNEQVSRGFWGPAPITSACVLVVLMATWCLSETASVRADDFSQQQLEIFEKRIRPLLAEHCLQCHGPEKQEGGFNLVTRESLIKGGDSGSALVAGKPNESLLIEAVEYLSEPKMPPSGKLPAEKIEHLRRWVESGAAWPRDSPLSEGA
ncbi:MAG: c-type cytochrome domain-containing protein, partial [Planctomycetaceae bacterium]